MSNFLQNIFTGVSTGANYLLTLTAGVESSIHSLESSSPLVGAAIQLAEQEVGAFPVVGQAEAVANAILSFAQMLASATTAAAPNAPAVAAKPTGLGEATHS